MSELPTLRAALRETAERRYPRRRRPLVPALVAVAAVAAALLIVRAPGTSQPSDEVPATPTASVTLTPSPSPAMTPRQIPRIDPKDLRATPVAPDDPSLKEAVSLLDSSHEVVRAWKVPGLKGHVLLTRKGAEWCLSAPDPLTEHPDAERGVGCVPSARYTRRGAYVGLISPDRSSRISVTVRPDGRTIRVRQR